MLFTSSDFVKKQKTGHLKTLKIPKTVIRFVVEVNVVLMIDTYRYDEHTHTHKRTGFDYCENPPWPL